MGHKWITSNLHSGCHFFHQKKKFFKLLKIIWRFPKNFFLVYHNLYKIFLKDVSKFLKNYFEVSLQLFRNCVKIFDFFLLILRNVSKISSFFPPNFLWTLLEFLRNISKNALEIFWNFLKMICCKLWPLAGNHT